eukprot:g1126.t1
MPLGRRRRAGRTPTRRSRPPPPTPPPADEGSGGAPSESDGDDESPARTERHRPKRALLRLLVLASAALVVAVLLVQGLKWSGGRRATRRSRHGPSRGTRRTTAARARKKSGGDGARGTDSNTANTASFCRSGVHPADSLRRRMEMFFETVNDSTEGESGANKLNASNRTERRIGSLVQKYGTTGDESRLVLHLRHSFRARKIAGFFNCTLCVQGGMCSAGRLSACRPGFVAGGAEALPCDYEDYQRGRCNCFKDTLAQKTASEMVKTMVRHLDRHASTQLCAMRRRGDSHPGQHVYLHELPECWIDEFDVAQIVRSVSASSSLNRRTTISQADWDLALRVGISGGWIKRRDRRLVLQSEISDIALPMWCEIHLGLVLEHAEYAVICLVLALSAFSMGECTGEKGMTGTELADALQLTPRQQTGMHGEVLQCLSDLEWLGVAVRDDLSGGASKTRWFAITMIKNDAAQNLQSWFRARGGPKSIFVPLFSQQVHPAVREAQVKFWRSHFSGAKWKGKKIRVDRAITTCGRVLAESVAQEVFDIECSPFVNERGDDVVDGWWENPDTKKNFQVFSKSISTWVGILRHEHDNVINPGRSDNVCTVGELEETLPEFKALPHRAKWKILHALAAKGVAKLDVTGQVSDTGIIWTRS